MDLSFVIPVYNSADLASCHAGLLRHLSGAGLDLSYELIFVDDGSDQPVKQILDLLSKEEHVRVVLHERNFGQSEAVLTGIRVAQGAFIILLDDDLEYDPSFIADFWQKFSQGFDLVNGLRVERSYRTRLYRAASGLSSAVLRILSRAHFKDSSSPYKGFRRAACPLTIFSPSMRAYPQEALAFCLDKAVEIPLKKAADALEHPSRYRMISLAWLWLGLIGSAVWWYAARKWGFPDGRGPT